MTHDEGRVSRWSRLKRKGGASPVEEVEAEAAAGRGKAAPVAAQEATEDSKLEMVPDPTSLPGGRLPRKFAPAMRPLAEPDENDLPYEAPQADALAMLDDGIGPGLPADKDIDIGHGEEVDEEERELTPEEEEAVRELPPLESLSKDSDFTPFMADKIPEFIRRRALRMLWRSHPAIKFVDGLDDYDENFRIIDKLITAADSTYEAGKGYPSARFDGSEEEAEEEVVDAEGDEEGDEKDAAVAPASGGTDSVRDTKSGEFEDEEFPNDVADAVDEEPESFSRHDVRPPDDT